MVKQLQITPKIAAALAASTQGAVAPESVAVYETISMNTLPITQRGLFDKAVASESLLQAMADALNRGENVPLHTLHLQGAELPVGKTFAGEIFDLPSGGKELRTLFYLPKTEADLIAKLDADVINEVSVGVQAKHLNCSECGWDYRSEEATFSNFWELTCANDHQIGKGGVHLRLNGLERFMEQSLVSLGAAKGAKIQGRTKALMAAASYEKLAASGIPAEMVVLNATSPLKPKEPDMDMTALINDLTTAKATVQVQTTQLAAANDALKTLQDQLAATQAELAAAKAKVLPAQEELAAQLKAAQDANTEMHNIILADAKRVAVAIGAPAPADTATLAELQASIQTNRVKMQETFPVGGAKIEPQFAASSFTQSAFKGA